MAMPKNVGCITELTADSGVVSWCGLVVRCKADKDKDLGLILSLQKLWFMDIVLWLCQHN